MWHRRSNKGNLRGKERRLAVIQNQALRNVTGAFKILNTETLEAEAYTPPIGMFMDQMQDRSTLRMRDTGRERDIQHICTRIKVRLQPMGPRGVESKRRKERTLNLDTALAHRPQANRPNQTDLSSQKIIALYHRDQWEKRWESYRQRVATASRTPAQNTPLSIETLRLHDGMAKAESTLATHIRTERIGLKAYLAQCHVPGFDSECGWNRQTAKHILAHCPTQAHLRPDLLGDTGIMDYHRLTSTSKGLRAAARCMMKTGLLEQFNVARTLLYGEV